MADEIIGRVAGEPGDDGFSPTIAVKTSTETDYILTVTNKTSSFDTPNLKGGSSSGGNPLYADVKRKSLDLDYTIAQWQFQTSPTHVVVTDKNVRMTAGNGQTTGFQIGGIESHPYKLIYSVPESSRGNTTSLVQLTYVKKDGSLGDHIFANGAFMWETFYLEFDPNSIPDANRDASIPALLIVGWVNETGASKVIDVSNVLLINDEYAKYSEIKENLEDSLKALSTSATGSIDGINVMLLGDSLTAAQGDVAWHYYANKILGFSTITNVAMGGATLRDKADTGAYDGNPDINNPSQNVLGNQIQKIINNKAVYPEPDLIVIGIGLNDMSEFADGIQDFTDAEIAAVYYDGSYNKIPIENANRKTTLGAFRYVHEGLHLLYPNAVIIFISETNTYQAERDPVKVMQYSERFERMTRFVSLPFIDAKRCGINWANEFPWESPSQPGEYLYDGLHHNSKGAKLFGGYIAGQLKQYMPMIKYMKEL